MTIALLLVGLLAIDPPVQRELLRLPPGKRGDFAYANDGYLTVGVILERVTGKPWEALMRERLFAPLEMPSCGFGPPATAGKVDAPWAHRVQGDRAEPVAPGPDADNPPAVGPAGTVHCSLPDWARFVEEHVRGERGEPTRLAIPAAIYRRLHTPAAGGEYAFGWAVLDRPWAGGPLLAHDGSNKMFYASVHAAPARNRVLLVAANRGDEAAGRAVHAVMDFLAAEPRARP